MKTRLILLTLAIFLIAQAGINGQVTNFLKKKIEKAAGEDTGKVSKPRVNPLAGFFSGGDEVEHKDSYDFTFMIVMEMQVYEDGEEVVSVMEYISYVNPSNGDVAIKIIPVSGEAAQPGMSGVLMIYDQVNNSSLVLTDMGSQKTAIATKMDELVETEGAMEADQEPPENYSYTRTGQTKTILGYKCEGYVVQDGENRVNMWVAEDVTVKMGAKKMEKAGIPGYWDGPFEGGMVMQMESFEGDIRKMDMLVKEIDNNANQTFSLQGYTIMNMGNR